MVHTSNPMILAPGRQRDKSHLEFQFSMVYIASSMSPGLYSQILSVHTHTANTDQQHKPWKRTQRPHCCDSFLEMGKAFKNGKTWETADTMGGIADRRRKDWTSIQFSITLNANSRLRRLPWQTPPNIYRKDHNDSAQTPQKMGGSTPQLISRLTL